MLSLRLSKRQFESYKELGTSDTERSNCDIHDWKRVFIAKNGYFILILNMQKAQKMQSTE